MNYVFYFDGHREIISDTRLGVLGMNEKDRSKKIEIEFEKWKQDYVKEYVKNGRYEDST